MLIDWLGYRGLFAGLAGVGFVATAVVALFVPETLNRAASYHSQDSIRPENDSHSPATAFVADTSHEDFSA